MKKYIVPTILTLLTFISAPTAAAPKTPAEPVEIQIVQEATLSKSDIFDNTRLWMAESYKSSEAVIDLQDKELGTIIGNGSADLKIGWGVYTPMTFKIRIDVKENKYRITFNKINIVFDSGAKPIESANRKSLEPKAKKAFEEMAASLDSYLTKAKKGDDW